MAKWLARLGWEVTVLTTTAFAPRCESASPSDADPHLAAELGAVRGDADGVDVIRTRDMQTWRARLAGHDRVESLFDADSYTGEPHVLSKLIVPEPLAVAWAPFARHAALVAHRRNPFDCVLTTSPPESVHAIGLALQRRNVRWVADVRDAWTFESLRQPFPSRLQHRFDERLERRWLGGADEVVCVSEPAAADLRERGIASPSVIANAWDPDSDPSAEALASVDGLLDPERVSILYTGRFGGYGRDPGALVEAVGALGTGDKAIAERLELAIAGPLTPAERSQLEAAAAGPAEVTLLGSLERERSLALQRGADALLLLAQPARSQLVNFKLFEYLVARRPILALAAGTEAGRIASAVGIEPVVRADDPGAIAAALRRAARRNLAGPDPSAAERYAYPAAAEAMSAVLRRR